MQIVKTQIELGVEKPFIFLQTTDTHLVFTDENDTEARREFARARGRDFSHAEENAAFIRQYVAKTGYPIVSICPSEIRYIKADYSLHDVSPEEFLGLYSQAAIVVSASFHGTAFGLLFEKPSYGLIRSTHANRIREILALGGLERFCIDTDTPIPEPEIDVDSLREKLDAERTRSLAYLTNLLKEDSE